MSLSCPNCGHKWEPRRKPLTKRERELLDVIERSIKVGFAPTFREMRDALHTKSISSVVRLTESLEDKGWVVTRRYRRRGISLSF